NDAVQCTGGRLGARDPQAAACGERGEVERGQEWGHARRAGHRLSPPRFPRPSPQGTSEALPYGILRRMSTDDHGTGPSGCGAVIVGGLIGQTDDHVVLHHGCRVPSLAIATVHAGFVTRTIQDPATVVSGLPSDALT